MVIIVIMELLNLITILGMIKIGGFLIFDDTNSFEHLLKNIWNDKIKKSDFISMEFNEHGLGVSIATNILVKKF